MKDQSTYKHKVLYDCGQCGEEFEFDTRDFIIFDPGHVTCDHCKTRQRIGQSDKIKIPG